MSISRIRPKEIISDETAMAPVIRDITSMTPPGIPSAPISWSDTHRRTSTASPSRNPKDRTRDHHPWSAQTGDGPITFCFHCFYTSACKNFRGLIEGLDPNCSVCQSPDHLRPRHKSPRSSRYGHHPGRRTTGSTTTQPTSCVTRRTPHR